MEKLSYTTSELDTSIKEQLDDQPKQSVVWDDITNSLIGRTLSSVAGKIDYNWNENSITMQSGGSISNSADRIVFNIQKPHAMSNTAPNNTMNLHMHWEQIDATAREITVQYRIQSNNAVKTTAWTTVTVDTNINNTFVYPGSGTFNQITKLVNIDLSSVTLSSTVQFRVARTDSVAGDIEVTFIDVHIPFDQIGSRQEYIK